MTLQELFGIRLPVIQAPMAGSQGSDLAVAVSNAGGLGSLPRRRCPGAAAEKSRKLEFRGFLAPVGRAEHQRPPGNLRRCTDPCPDTVA